MRTGWRVLFGPAILAVAAVGLLGCYKMGTVREYEVNSPSIEPKVLLATQGSAFKDAIVHGVIDHLKQRAAYVRVIDVGALRSANESEWDAILVIHTWEMGQPQRDAKRFIDRVKNTRKLVLVSTSGVGTLKMEGVDEISSASIMSDVPARVAEINARLDGILTTQKR